MISAKTIDLTLSVFGYSWLVIVSGYVLLTIVGIFLETEGAWNSAKLTLYYFSPFNPMNLLVELIVISPAVIAFHARERRRRMAR